MLVGIAADDTEKDMDYIINKILNIRVFDDEATGTMWKKGVKDLGLEVLCGNYWTIQEWTFPTVTELILVSQFTLQGQTSKGICQRRSICLYTLLKLMLVVGNKPDFHKAMKTEQAKAMYEQFLTKMGKMYDPSKIKG